MRLSGTLLLKLRFCVSLSVAVREYVSYVFAMYVALSAVHQWQVGAPYVEKIWCSFLRQPTCNITITSLAANLTELPMISTVCGGKECVRPSLAVENVIGRLSLPLHLV